MLWERATGRPVHNAIVWQDRRTADRCAELKAGGKEARVRELTGLTIDPYFSGTKVRWMLDHVDGLAARARAGDIAFGTIDCYLLSRLSSRAVHATDVTNASRTLLFDIHELAWSDELCEVIGVPRAILPEVVASSGIVGTTKGVVGDLHERHELAERAHRDRLVAGILRLRARVADVGAAELGDGAKAMEPAVGTRPVRDLGGQALEPQWCRQARDARDVSPPAREVQREQAAE